MKDDWVREEFCRDFGLLGKKFFAGSQQNVKKAKAFSAFLGNDKERESAGLLTDIM